MTHSDVSGNETALVHAMQLLVEKGLNTGSAGNASFRLDRNTFCITPSGIKPSELTESQLAVVGPNSDEQSINRPSSEWRMHHDVYHAKPDISAIVHTHSRYATALACNELSIPAFHYMVAIAGGNSIRCAPYATFGTQLLSDTAIAALSDRRACLLANHGVLALGNSVDDAVRLAIEVETLAEQYTLAIGIGNPTILGDDEMARVIEKFKTYGQPHE